MLLQFKTYCGILLLYRLYPSRVLEESEGEGIEGRIYFIHEGDPAEDIRFERGDSVEYREEEE